MLLLTVAIWGHISELFDRWDNTLKTGKDVEYSSVLLAVVIGSVLCASHLLAILFRAPRSCETILLVHSGSFTLCPLQVSDTTIHSPPLSLRV